jgi:geranylgeranyl pyrophosphate synthase
LREFGDLYGVAFQMVDDLLDMTSDERTLGKPVGNDLHEHKVTIPVVSALRRGDPELRRHLAAFYNGGEDGAIPEIVAEIAAQGGLDGTRAEIAEYSSRAKAALAPLAQSSARAELERLAHALIA